MARKVLIVEDDAGTRLVLKLALKDQGFEVVEAGDGDEACRAFDRVFPDLVLTDLDLPVLDGFALIAHIMNTRPSVPVIVVSGMDRTLAQERILHAFRLAHLSKPVDLERLALIVSQALSTRGSMTGVTLFGFVQMLSLENQSSTLRISDDSREGLLCLEKGMVVEALCEGLRGLDAAFELLSWNEPTIEILPPRNLVEKSITIPTMELLFEGARRKDESQSEWLDDESEETVSGAELDSPVAPSRSDDDMMALSGRLAAAMHLPGVVAAAVFDRESAEPLVTVGFEGSGVAPTPRIVRSLTGVLEGASASDLDHIVVSFARAIWLFKPAGNGTDVYLLELAHEIADPNELSRVFGESESAS